MKWDRENRRFVTYAQRAYNARGGPQITADGLAGEQTLSAYSPRCWPMANLADGREWVVTSGYGMRGRGKSRHMHPGIDGFYRLQLGDKPASPRHACDDRWWYPKGAMAIAAHTGEVVAVEMRFYGMRVSVRDAMGDVTKYLHGYQDQVFVTRGQVVELADPIFVCGHDQRTGRGPSEPIHLHFEVWRDGRHMDPVKWLRYATRAGYTDLAKGALAPPSIRPVGPTS